MSLQRFLPASARPCRRRNRLRSRPTRRLGRNRLRPHRRGRLRRRGFAPFHLEPCPTYAAPHRHRRAFRRNSGRCQGRRVRSPNRQPQVRQAYPLRHHRDRLPRRLRPASEYLYGAVSRLAARKPVIAFVRGVGASGSYMVACGATKIIALPSSIIGSIGVISIGPVAKDLLSASGSTSPYPRAGPTRTWAPFTETRPKKSCRSGTS